MQQPWRVAAVAALLTVLGVLTWAAGWRVYGWYHRSAGADLLKHDRSRLALGHLQMALTVWPDDPALLLLAARAARRTSNFNLAQVYLEQCQAASAPDGAVEMEHALLRAMRGEGDAVAGYCDALALQDDADAPLIFEAMAEGYLMRLRLPEATYYVDRWLERVPASPQALYMKGRIAADGSSITVAADLFRQVVELDSDHDDARWELAQLQLDLGQAQEALANLEFLGERMPHNILVRVRLARCFDLLGRQDEAVAMLDDVLSRQPQMVPALVERGRIAVRARDLARAEECLTAAASRAPGNHDAQYQLMLCFRGQGKKAEADAVMERMKRIEKDAVRLREIAGGELSRQPSNAALHAEIGAIHMRLGAFGEGVRWLDSAVRLDPRQVDAHRALAAHYRAMGQFGRAERHRALAEAAKASP